MKRSQVFFLGLMIACPIAMGAEQQAGDWRFSASGDISVASTTSDTGASFGILCSRQKSNCVYYLGTSEGCDEGSTYPILVNGDKGASTLTGTCHIIGSGASKSQVLFLSPMSDVVTMIGTSQHIGFAFPMLSGQFVVFRFSLNGASATTASATNYLSQATGDQVL